jgi:hypothetical protein
LEESKVVSSYPFMFNARQILRAAIFSLLLFLFAAAHVTFAHAQNFTLTASALSPSAGIDPGGYATATIALNTTTGFSNPVTFTCTVTSTQVTSDLPQCSPPSPDPSVPDAILSLTVTTVGATPAGQYTITVTGTSGSETPQTATLFLSVIPVPQDYTLSVTKAISPGTVTAGSGAQATVTVTPLAGYIGNVTLSCFSVTPVVTASPICAFNPPTVAVTNGAGPTSVLTVSTYGTTGTGNLWTIPRIFYGFWMAFPALALIAAGASGTRGKKWMGMLLVMAAASGLLFLPSCSAASKHLNNSNGFTTPKNTYTFTLTGVDANGVTPSNTTTTSAQATVALTVD